MTVKSLRKYLQAFPPDVKIRFWVGNPDSCVRKIYPVNSAWCTMDIDAPTMMIEVGEPKDMDEEVGE